MRELKGAQFDPEDPELANRTGPCSKCPQLAGNQAQFFDELKKVGRGDVCLSSRVFSTEERGGLQDRLGCARKKREGRGQAAVMAGRQAAHFRKKHRL
jgi:hypothetical protein